MQIGEIAEAENGGDEDEIEDTKERFSEELFEKNLSAFERFGPNLHRMLLNHKPLSKLVYSGNGEPNVDYQGTLLYPVGAVTTADEQIGAFETNSTRLFMGRITPDSLDPHSKEAFVKITDRFNDSGFKFTHSPYRENSFFAIVLGVGLGLHLERILERTRCRMLVIVEPNMDFLYHSLYVADWEAIFDYFDGRGVVEVHIENTPKIIAQLIKPVFRAHNPMSLDGGVVFEHYPSTIFSETNRVIPETLRTAVMGLGFYQDEINMIAQSYKNLESGKYRVISRAAPAPDLPALIVGSGPSFSDLAPFLKENQHKAVIFSCGSSLYLMMKNGITPDFWVFPERNAGGVDIPRETSTEFDLSGICFIGSSTVFPTHKDFFDDTIFFFRPGLSSNPVFAQNEGQVLSIPDPLAANTGLSAAMHLGFKETYFLGVDCGSYIEGKTHASGNWYETFDKDYHGKYTIPHPGNFGGTVWSDAVMQWSKENIEKTIQYNSGRTFYNLGRGALFKYTAPRHPKSVDLPEPPIPKNELVRKIIESCPIYTKAEFDEAWEKAALIDRMYDLCEEFKEAVREEDDFEDFEYLKNLVEILKPAQISDALTMMYRGTLMSTVIAFEYYMNRAVDAAERKVMWQIFVEEFSDQIDRLRDRAIEIFTGLEDGLPWEDDFIS